MNFMCRRKAFFAVAAFFGHECLPIGTAMLEVSQFWWISRLKFSY